MAWPGRATVGRSSTAVLGLQFSRLSRVRADGSSPPERLELAGQEACCPFTVTSRDRLAFSAVASDIDILRFRPGADPTPLLASTAWDSQAHYSPDGLRIAFESMREGETEEIWLADADGSNPTRLTRGPGRHQGSPRWSPDGRTIAFDSGQSESGHWDVWTIGSDGSRLRQVTRDPNDDVHAELVA